MKKYIFLIVIYLTTMSTTCIRKVDRENTLCIENMLSDSIYIIPNYSYPDQERTTFSKSMLKHSPTYQVPASSISRVGFPGLCKEHVWKQLVPSDTVQILVLNKDSIDNGSEDSFNEYLTNKKYIRMYKITYNDIINNKCRLVIE